MGVEHAVQQQVGQAGAVKQCRQPGQGRRDVFVVNRPRCFQHQVRLGIVEEAAPTSGLCQRRRARSTPMCAAGDGSAAADTNVLTSAAPARPMTPAWRK